MRAYHEWLPIRERPGAGGLQIWRSFASALADLIMLDTRLHGRSQQVGERTDRAARSPGRSMLVPDQAAWLAEELRASVRRGSAWHVIGQQLMFGQLVDDDRRDSQRRPVGRLSGVTPAGARPAGPRGDRRHDHPDRRHPQRLGARHRASIRSVMTTTARPAAARSPWNWSRPRSRRRDRWPAHRRRGGNPRAGDRRQPPAHPLRQHARPRLPAARPDAERAQAEWWLVEGIDARLSGERLGAAFVIRRGTNRLDERPELQGDALTTR
jgi:hypothetical protein